MEIKIKLKSNPSYTIIIFRNTKNEIGFHLTRNTIIDRIFNFGGCAYLDSRWIEEHKGIDDCSKRLLEEIYNSLENNKVTTNIRSSRNLYLLAVVSEIKDLI